ncbi:MAG: nuclear transport factor 2 family protein [Gammaproteobacteria bacterium]|nr:nuclear transport factor 2 family protein [Gammaproteobacteria bacterium]
MAFPEPTAAEQAFYDAFRALDLSAMQTVWADSAEISCVHPGGQLLRGTGDVLASWREIFEDASPPRVDYRLVQASRDQRLAVHTVEERVLSGGGRRAVVVATNVYVLGDGGWSMLAHHASLPLVERPRSPQAERPLH